MLSNEEKEKLILTKISDTLRDLDAEIEILEIKEPEETLAIKKWFINKKTLHEIKYLASRAGAYNNYNDNELDDIELSLNASLDN